MEEGKGGGGRGGEGGGWQVKGQVKTPLKDIFWSADTSSLQLLSDEPTVDHL